MLLYAFLFLLISRENRNEILKFVHFVHKDEQTLEIIIPFEIQYDHDHDHFSRLTLQQFQNGA